MSSQPRSSFTGGGSGTKVPLAGRLRIRKDLTQRAARTEYGFSSTRDGGRVVVARTKIGGTTSAFRGRERVDFRGPAEVTRAGISRNDPGRRRKVAPEVAERNARGAVRPRGARVRSLVSSEPEARRTARGTSAKRGSIVG